MNVRVNYLPPQLMDTCAQSKNSDINCEHILDVVITKGDKATVGINRVFKMELLRWPLATINNGNRIE